MIVLYRFPGFIASLALTGYVVLMLLILSIRHITLTLPGIAGIILSIGMAVDANVIIFTRIREEISASDGVRAAVKAGFSKALSAILDGNITTLIATVVLMILGSGSIKGIRGYIDAWYCPFYVYRIVCDKDAFEFVLRAWRTESKDVW